VFAHTDDMALGSARAIADAGLTDKAKVVGLDGSPYGLTGVKDGTLAATVAQQVLLMGRTAMQTAIKVAAGEKVDAFVPVDTVLVTPDNVERVLAPVSAAAPGQSPAAAPAALPVVVSGTEVCDNRGNGETMPLEAGLTGGQGMVAICIDTMSDPRVSGAYVNTLAYECMSGTTACTWWGTHPGRRRPQCPRTGRSAEPGPMVLVATHAPGDGDASTAADGTGPVGGGFPS
jgi:hypothetical protein